jgi:ribulose-phosphate 3-epimerase
VAINPATPISALEEVIPDVDFVLVMSVNPGFGGQQFIPSVLQKIRKLRERISSNNYRARIEIDGGVDVGNLDEVLAAGVDVVVVGSAIFKSGSSPFDAVREIKEMADRLTSRLDRV